MSEDKQKKDEDRDSNNHDKHESVQQVTSPNEMMRIVMKKLPKLP